MISHGESLNTIEYKNSYIICPHYSEYNIWDQKHHLRNKPSAKKFPENISYNSLTNKKFLSIKEIKKLLIKNRFI